VYAKFRILLFLPLVGFTSCGLFYAFAFIVLLTYTGEQPSEVNVYESGTAHGVTIGTSKDQVYSDLLQEYTLRRLTMDDPRITDASAYFNIIDEVAYPVLMSLDHWEVNLTFNLPNTLELFFYDDKLIKIIRSRWPSAEH
jgi:hypothetical protein